MDDAATQRIIPVILCGGAGTRLWPLSRLARPKPLVSLTGSETMIQLTARRTAGEAMFAPAMVVVGSEDADAVEAQLDAAGLPPASVIVEPSARGTAAAIALAALNAAPEALLLVMPSDHAIADEAAFRAAVAAAAPHAAQGWLVTFGVAPDRPETGYGYVQRGDALGEGVFRAARFVEKPARETAEAYLRAGDHDWNAGIFLLRADAFLAALEAHAPAIAAAARAAVAGQRREGRRRLPDQAALARAPAEAIDRAVMERSDKVAVVPVEMGWSDLGSWEAVHAAGEKDPNGNVIVGDAVAPASEGCLVRTDGPVVVALGVKDLVIVATERAVLVVPRGESQRVKEAIDALEARRQKGGQPSPEGA